MIGVLSLFLVSSFITWGYLYLDYLGMPESTSDKVIFGIASVIFLITLTAIVVGSGIWFAGVLV